MNRKPIHNLWIILLLILCISLITAHGVADSQSAPQQSQRQHLPIVRTGCNQTGAISLPNELQVGVTHVAGDYRFTNENFLLEGVQRIESLGAQAVFVYLTASGDNRATSIYPANNGTPWNVGSQVTLVELARSEPYQKLFSMPFTTFVLTTYSNAIPSPLFGSEEYTPEDFAAEEQQIYELVSYLLTTYVGCNKRFILKNWEADSI